MEVCEVCGAFLIIGDAQARVDDHLMGKQHMGYAKIKSTVEELRVSVLALPSIQSGFMGQQQGSTKIKILAWPLDITCTSVSLACSYFELAQSSVNSGTRHENFYSGLPIGQVTTEICLPDGKAYLPLNIGHNFFQALPHLLFACDSLCVQHS